MRLPPFLTRCLALALPWAVLLAAPPLHADTRTDAYTQVQNLHAAGQTDAALAQADTYIAAHPGDPQMRFVKAGLLSASGQTDAAEALLQQLTRDYPELPEPWNNLAVLHAGRGQLEQAADALQQALLVNPAYATALENLGDVRMRQALQAWQQAQQADPGASARLAPRIRALQGIAPDAAP